MERYIFNQYLDLLGYKDRPLFLDKYLTVPSLQRLKQVGYFCGMDFASKDIYNFKEKISRYDHSLTVALTTWMLTKNKEATLAGLFHDISTPCFSHVIDYMNRDYEKQESTEEKTEEIIRNDKYLITYLSEDKIELEDIIDFKKYSIVDNNRPKLCADRLDGVILTGLYWTKNINIDDIKRIIDNVIVIINEDLEEEIAFTNIEIASLVVDTSILIDKYCHSREDNYMMELLARITKKIIELNIITYEDLFILNEDELFYIFNNCTDIEIKENLRLFKNIRKDEIYNIEIPKCKIRDLNPLIKTRRYKSR